MMVHEVCGISAEDADRIEMSIREAICGRSMTEANDIILKTILESEYFFKEAVYMAFVYGSIVGMIVGQEIQQQEIKGVE